MPSHLTPQNIEKECLQSDRKAYMANYHQKRKEDGYAKISIRLDKAQKKQLDQEAKRQRTKTATLIKTATFAYLDQVFIFDESLWSDLISALSRIGNNINQVARRVNQSAYHGVESPLNKEAKEIAERYKELESVIIQRFKEPFDLAEYLTKAVEANPRAMDTIKAIVQKLEQSRREAET